jgi:hypothetical protein
MPCLLRPESTRGHALSPGGGRLAFQTCGNRKSGIVLFGNHALDRMKERNATRGDVRSALTSATPATFQPDNGRWKITGGTDRSGDALDMAVVFENGLVVITVF